MSDSVLIVVGLIAAFLLYHALVEFCERTDRCEKLAAKVAQLEERAEWMEVDSLTKANKIKELELTIESLEFDEDDDDYA